MVPSLRNIRCFYGGDRWKIVFGSDAIGHSFLSRIDTGPDQIHLTEGVEFMSKSIKAAAAAAVLSLILPVVAYASDGTVTFTGQLTASTCTVDNPNQTVILPQVSTASLTTPGQTLGQTYFNIDLSNCTAGVNVSAFFEAGPNVNAGGRLTNTGGSATGVDVELFNTAGTAINIGVAGQTAPVVPDATGAARLRYSAAYHRIAGSISAGNVDTSVTYAIDYQ